MSCSINSITEMWHDVEATRRWVLARVSSVLQQVRRCQSGSIASHRLLMSTQRMRIPQSLLSKKRTPFAWVSFRALINYPQANWQRHCRCASIVLRQAQGFQKGLNSGIVLKSDRCPYCTSNIFPNEGLLEGLGDCP